MPANSLKTVICACVCAKPHPRVKAKKNNVPVCRTITLPYTSESGEVIRGPTVQPRKKIESIKADAVSPPVTLRSCRMAGKLGATIVELKGLKKANRLTVVTTSHFFDSGQFLGFVGSPGPAKETYSRVSLISLSCIIK